MESIEHFQLRHSESLREEAEHYRKSQVLVLNSYRDALM